jgi:hypothetical protein
VTGPVARPASWADLVAVAVVGTERRPWPAATAPDGTDLAPAGATDEARVLATAAVLATWRAAGWRPAPEGAAVPDPAPEDEHPPCSPRAAQLLDVLMGSGTAFADQRGLIVHWLDACAGARRRPLHRHLIPLLSRATAEPSLRPAVAAVVDRRGRWLAARHPDWRWGVEVGRHQPPVDVAGWATADRAARLALLARLRVTAPDDARRLVASDLDGLPAGERAELVEALAVGLGPADEALLDDLLDDRARSVRVAAAALLDRLPGSRRADRLAERLAALIDVSGRLRRRVEVGLPDEADPLLTRDLPGEPRMASPVVVAVAAQLGMAGVAQGRRAALLQRLVAAAPLATWRRAGADPAAVVAAAEERRELVVGLAAAVVAQRDAAWAAALFERLPLPALVPLVAPAAAEDQIGGRVTRAGDGELAGVVAAAAQLPAPWSGTFSATVVARFAMVDNVYVIATHRDLLAARLHPAVISEVEEWAAALTGDERRPARRQVRQLHQALTMRRAISEELQP